MDCGRSAYTSTSDAVVTADGSGSNDFSHYGALGAEEIDVMEESDIESVGSSFARRN